LQKTDTTDYLHPLIFIWITISFLLLQIYNEYCYSNSFS
jgi:hypothetical protein